MPEETSLTIIKRGLREYNLLLMLAIIVAIATFMTKGLFLKPSNLITIVARTSITAILALGEGLVIISGEFDLSIGSLLAVAIVVIASIIPVAGLLGATILAIVATTVLGVINGILVAKTPVPSFIVTLGMMSIARSTAFIVIPGRDIVVYDFKNAIAPIFSSIPRGTNIFPIFVLGFLILSLGIFLHRTRYGQYIYAIGGNEKSASVCGLPVSQMKILVFSISGFLCSIAGIVYLYRVSGAAPSTGEEFLLMAIAGAIIGGVYLYGGEGSVGGILVGSMILVIINNVLTLAGISPIIHKAVLGGITLGGVFFQQWVKGE